MKIRGWGDNEGEKNEPTAPESIEPVGTPMTVQMIIDSLKKIGKKRQVFIYEGRGELTAITSVKVIEAGVEFL